MLALEAKRFVAPRELQKLIDLFEDLPIYTIGFALVAAGGAGMNLLRHLVEPARLVAASEADDRAPFGQLVQPRYLQRQPQRVPPRQHIADGAGLDPFGVLQDVLCQHRQAPHLDPFAMQMMLGESDRFESHVFRQLRDLDDLFDHPLPAILMHRDGAQRTPLFERCGQRRQEKIHELHAVSSMRTRSQICVCAGPLIAHTLRSTLDGLRHVGTIGVVCRFRFFLNLRTFSGRNNRRFLLNR
jgi:hypothetical protein